MPSYTVSNSIDIQCQPADTFALVRDFQSWPTWSPWLLAEPDATLTYFENNQGYAWDGAIVGQGNIRFSTEQPGERIDCQLAFLKPFKCNNAVSFRFASKSSGLTTVTWEMDASLPWFLFWMKTMMANLNAMDFGRGLTMLKCLLEKGKVPSQLDILGPGQTEVFYYIGLREKCAIDAVGPSMEAAIGQLVQAQEAGKFTPAGPPRSIYHKWDLSGQSCDYTVCFPVAEKLAEAAPFITGTVPATPAYQIRYTGPYDLLGNAWSAGMARQFSKVYRPNKAIAPFEIYENSPHDTPEDALVTQVNFPMKP